MSTEKKLMDLLQQSKITEFEDTLSGHLDQLVTDKRDEVRTEVEKTFFTPISERQEIDEAKKGKMFSFGKDKNGNSTLKIKTQSGGFSIQTNGNLPDTHRMRDRKMDMDKIKSEVKDYVTSHGTKKQKMIIKDFDLMEAFEVEKMDVDAKFKKSVKEIENLVDNNEHTKALRMAANLVGLKAAAKELQKLEAEQNKFGYLTPKVSTGREKQRKNISKFAKNALTPKAFAMLTGLVLKDS